MKSQVVHGDLPYRGRKTQIWVMVQNHGVFQGKATFVIVFPQYKDCATQILVMVPNHRTFQGKASL